MGTTKSEFIWAISLFLFVVLGGLFIVADVPAECCYCGAGCGTQPRAMSWIGSDLCHWRCFKEANPIPPERNPPTARRLKAEKE